MKKPRCKGHRRQMRGGTFGRFKCTRNATQEIETQVGFTERHPACDDEECISSIACGYPVTRFPFKKQ